MKERPKTAALPSLFEGPDDDLFAGINAGDGTYPEPTDEDRRAFRRIVSGGTLFQQITDLRGD